jgi:hypothetical protein
MELTDEWGRTLPTFEHRGHTYVLGEPGQRYLLRVRNGSGRRVEVVASVDGRDVADGQPAAWQRRGYLVEPYGEVTIDGYRLSQASVAAFRFGSVARSYAAAKGDARDVGVVGVAVFTERAAPQRPPYSPYLRPYPYPRGEGSSPRSEAAPGRSSDAPAGERAEKHSGSAEAPSAAMRDSDRSRPGLGTEFGEAHGSPVVEVPRRCSRSVTTIGAASPPPAWIWIAGPGTAPTIAGCVSRPIRSARAVGTPSRLPGGVRTEKRDGAGTRRRALDLRESRHVHRGY